MADIVLTKNQLEQINEDMNVHEKMLSDEETNALAQKVNKAINLPLIGEEKEFIVFVKVIKWIDQKLYGLLPNEYYRLVKDSTNGISKEEAAVIEERITPLINKAVNIPVLTENQEAKLIGLVLGLIINAMVKGFKLEELAVQ
ncbi:MAG: hypothetical protein HQ522_11515 [Bacteroidetes bacterium]|nr:hypothetical protein [Bacteroidota bacterium]